MTRFNLYAASHKALRLAMTDALVRLGQCNLHHAAQRRELVERLQALFDMCRSHIDKEDRFVHPLLEICEPGTRQRGATEHAVHLIELGILEAQTEALLCAPEDAAAHDLYRRLALFVAESFEHMEHEESAHNAALWAAYSDIELLSVHDAIVASIEPAGMAQAMHWMLPALNASERLGLLSGLRANAPPPALEVALAAAQARLPVCDWAQLHKGLAQVAMAA